MVSQQVAAFGTVVYQCRLGVQVSLPVNVQFVINDRLLSRMRPDWKIERVDTYTHRVTIFQAKMSDNGSILTAIATNQYGQARCTATLTCTPPQQQQQMKQQANMFSLSMDATLPSSASSRRTSIQTTLAAGAFARGGAGGYESGDSHYSSTRDQVTNQSLIYEIFCAAVDSLFWRFSRAASCAQFSNVSSPSASRQPSVIGGTFIPMRSPPMFTRQLKAVLTVTEHTRFVELSCYALASPPVQRIVWHYNEELIEIQQQEAGQVPSWSKWDRFQTIFENGVCILMISDLQLADAGRYSCTVENAFGMRTTMCSLQVVPSSDTLSPLPPMGDMEMDDSSVAPISFDVVGVAGNAPQTQALASEITEFEQSAILAGHSGGQQGARIVRPPRDVSFVRGGNVCFDCQVVGEPRPSVTWKRNGAAVAQTAR